MAIPARVHLNATSPGHRGSCAFLNYAIWESVDLFRQAFTHPDFQSHIADYPPSAVISPHLFQRMTVANLCVA